MYFFSGSAAYLLKLNNQGDFIWVKNLAENYYFNQGREVVVSVTGNVYVCGIFSGTADFDSAPSVFTMSTSLNIQDIFITKLDNAGNFIWVKQFSGTNGKGCYAVALDQFENIYTIGYFLSTVDFDPGVGVYNLSTINLLNNSDAFISKLDINGNFVYAKQISGLTD